MDCEHFGSVVFSFPTRPPGIVCPAALFVRFNFALLDSFLGNHKVWGESQELRTLASELN
jgi:hypothetical protein